MPERPAQAIPPEGESTAPEASCPGSELARLFSEHNASLVQLLRAKLRSEQEARDVAQEAYVRLLQLDRLGTVSYLRAYLFRTALNLATDRIRNHAMRGAAHRDPIFDPGVNELSPEKAVVAADELRVIEKALASLAPKARYAFLLYRVAGLDIEEVIERVGVGERMVRNYIADALVCCREAINEARVRKTQASRTDKGAVP
jgi:RNA polymerase sigma factor (sigma-70 family)